VSAIGVAALTPVRASASPRGRSRQRTGVWLVTANWFVFATGCLVFALLVIRCRTEEEKLIERFGDEYRAYAQRTGRFVPRFRTVARDTT